MANEINETKETTEAAEAVETAAVDAAAETEAEATPAASEESKPAMTPEEAAEAAKKAREERDARLKQLLVSSDFVDDNYIDLPLPELLILKNSAKKTKNNVPDEKLKEFMNAREDFFLHMIIRKIPKLESIICLFSKNTMVPYIVCDDETMNDQIWLYSNERVAAVAVNKMRADEGVELVPVKIGNKDFLQFFSSLFAMGVNEILVEKGFLPVAFDLSKFIKAPDYSQLPENQRPIMNPELTLTAIYFTEALSRPEAKRDMKHAAELEEEMIVNISRGRLIVPVIVPDGVETIDPKAIKIPYFKMPNGDTFQPICTDATEFMKFNRENKLKSIVVDGVNIKKALSSEVKGIMLNPATLKIAIPKQKL